jgi:hypothetical protein
LQAAQPDCLVNGSGAKADDIAEKIEQIPCGVKQVYNAVGLEAGNGNCQIDTGSARVSRRLTNLIAASPGTP